MKLHIGLAGVGAAIVFSLAAQSAQAQQCPIDGGDGGGINPIEVTPEGPGCEPPGGSYAPLSAVVENANGVVYDVSAEVENGFDYLEVGEVVEVEIDFDDVMAALKSDEQQALVLADAAGVRPEPVNPKSGFVNVSRTFGASAKLSESEMTAVATYVYASMQSGRATGRSDPAPNSWVSRIEATGQAISRAFDAIGRNIPSISLGMTHRTYHSNGRVRSETVMQAEVNPRSN